MGKCTTTKKEVIMTKEKDNLQQKLDEVTLLLDKKERQVEDVICRVFTYLKLSETFVEKY